MRRILLFLVLLLAVPSLVVAQSTRPTSQNGTLFGAHFVPVPEILQSHLPQLPKNQGLVIESLKKGSVAAKMGLRRHDILLKVQNTPIRETKQLTGLLPATPTSRANQIHIVRGGKPLTLSYTFQPEDLSSIAKSAVKDGGPPAVRLEAKRLNAGKLKVIVTCYGEGSKQQTITATGTPLQIEAKVRSRIREQNISFDVRDLVEVALRRLRDYNKH